MVEIDLGGMVRLVGDVEAVVAGGIFLLHELHPVVRFIIELQQSGGGGRSQGWNICFGRRTTGKRSGENHGNEPFHAAMVTRSRYGILCWSDRAGCGMLNLVKRNCNTDVKETF